MRILWLGVRRRVATAKWIVGVACALRMGEAEAMGAGSAAAQALPPEESGLDKPRIGGTRAQERRMHQEE